MKPKSVVLIAVIFVIASILGASGAISQAMGFDGWFGISAAAKPVQKPPTTAPSLDLLETNLKLQKDQKVEFNGFRSYCRCGLDTHRSRIASARMALGEAIAAEPTDRDAIDKARLELLKAYDNSQKEMIEKLLALKNSLDSDQKSQLASAFFPGCSTHKGRGKGRGSSGKGDCGRCGDCQED